MLRYAAWLCGMVACASAQQHELGLTLGGVVPSTFRGDRGDVELRPGRALQANYGYRLLNGRTWTLSGEVHFLAAPLREVRSQAGAATRDVASLFLTPGVRVKLRPRSRVSPYGTLGAGWALYEQSLTTISGGTNPAPRLANRAALQFGGGVDIRAWRFVAFRAELRDFVTGRPAFNVPVTGGRHHLVPGAGIVLQFGE